VTRRLALVAAAVLAVVAAVPVPALAHGLVGERQDLPIPTWLFGYAAAFVLGVSFALLSALWREPRLQEPRERRLFRIPVVVDVVCGLIGVAWFTLVVVSGIAGSEVAKANLAPTAIYVLFWVGTPVLSVLFGDVFRAFNPWLAVARVAALPWRGRGRTARAYPPRLGYWPAVAGIALFAWLELAYSRETPHDLATLALAYAVVQWVGMAAYGIEQWSRHGDAFGVYFNLFARLSPFERRDDRALCLRPPLSGAPRWPVLPGAVALLATAIGTTTFDGFSAGPVWASLGPDLRDLFGGGTTGVEIAATVGIVGCILFIGGFYRLGIEGMTTVGRHHDARELAGGFAHSLIPIAFAYLLAHYFSLLVFDGQGIAYLISDPLDTGADIFGTADRSIDYTFLSSNTIWYVQAAALVAGHVAGLVLAHDRALSIYEKAREATRSQYWMLVVMVGFTSLGLWLLSVIGER
jgi:hypothetical protein